MVGVRVEAIILDLSGAEHVLVADKEIRQKHFPPDKWIEVGTFCAPADIFTQLQKVDRMIDHDAEHTISHKTEVNYFSARLEAQDHVVIFFFLVCFSSFF
jgi:hypothetical protein